MNDNKDNVTYRDVLAALQKLTPEQLDMTATVKVQPWNEFLPVLNHARWVPGAPQVPVGITDVDDVLDAGHPYLLV